MMLVGSGSARGSRPARPRWFAASGNHRRGAGSRWASGLVALLLVVAATITGARPASAAPMGRVDAWLIDYRLDEQGLLHVSETLVWWHPNTAKPRSIDRELVTRKPFRNWQDITYEISDIEVHGPSSSLDGLGSLGAGTEIFREVIDLDAYDPGPPVAVEITDGCMPDNRHCTKRVHADAFGLGESPVIGYTISYVVSGTLGVFGMEKEDWPPGNDELYWTVFGPDDPSAGVVQAKVMVPEGSEGIGCFVGVSDPGNLCNDGQWTTPDGASAVGHREKERGTYLSIAVDIAPGLVSDNEPHLVMAALPDWAVGLLRGALLAVIGGVGLVIAAWIIRRRRLDATPLPSDSPAANNDGAADNAVGDPRRSPMIPDVPVVVSGLLSGRRTNPTVLGAVLLHLAAKGTICIGEAPGGSAMRVWFLNPYLPCAEWETRFMREIFRKRQVHNDAVVTVERATLDRFRIRSMIFEAAIDTAVEQGLIVPFKEGFLRGWLPVLAPFLVVAGALPLLFPGVGEIGSVDFFTCVFGVLGLAMSLLVGGRRVHRRARRFQLTAAGDAAVAQIRAHRERLRSGEIDRMIDPARNLAWAIAVEEPRAWAKICVVPEVAGLATDHQVPAWYVGDRASLREGRFFEPLLDGEPEGESPRVAPSDDLVAT